MRVTTGAFTSHYLKNNNSALETQLNIMDRIQSQRKYNRASEDSSSAAKAAHVRKSLANLDIYDENAKTAKSFFQAAEDSLYNIANDTYMNLNSKLTSAQSTMNQEQFDILALEIEQLAEHMTNDMNADFAERQMFGSTSNDKTPFTVYSGVKAYDADGNLVFASGSIIDEADTASLTEKTTEDVAYTDQAYDADGNQVVLDDLAEGAEVYDADGNIVGTKAADAGKVTVTKTVEKDASDFVYEYDDEVFYDADGNELCDKGVVNGELTPYNNLAEGTELYSKDGALIGTKGAGSDMIVLNGNTDESKLHFSNQDYYDEYGKKISDFNNFNGKTYYDSYDLSDENTVKYTVNVENDKATQSQEHIVCYNDVPVNLSGNDLLSVVNGGSIEYFDENGDIVKWDQGATAKTFKNTSKTTGDYSAFPGSDPIYVDIGLGINYSKLSETALDMSLNGAKITGCGTDKDGDPSNLIQLAYDAASALRSGDLESVNKYIDKISDAKGLVMNAITELGIQENNMDYYISKNEVYRISLDEKQNDLEGCDLTTEITNWKSAEAAYNATLSMGSSSLPKSLFDFI